MKKLFLILASFLVLISCKNESESSSKQNISNAKKNEFAIIIHGGAGTILKKNMSNEKEAAYKELTKIAAEAQLQADTTNESISRIYAKRIKEIRS